jgi:hypothetical protein
LFICGITKFLAEVLGDEIFPNCKFELRVFAGYVL